MILDDLDAEIVAEMRKAVAADVEIAAIVANAADSLLTVADDKDIGGRVVLAYALVKLLRSLEGASGDGSSGYVSALCKLCYRTQERLEGKASKRVTFHAGAGKAVKA